MKLFEMKITVDLDSTIESQGLSDLQLNELCDNIAELVENDAKLIRAKVHKNFPNTLCGIYT